MSDLLSAFGLQKWIDANREKLQPPVGNQQIWPEADLMVTIVGGPNKRTDFHDDPVDEFLYQLKGDMLLKLIDNGRRYDVRVKEGEVFRIPPHVRHSPQRPVAGSIGLVVEPQRPEGLMDGFEWYCFNCDHLVHRTEIDLVSIVDDIPAIYADFYSRTELHKCPNCGAMHPGKEPPAGWVEL
jgi:3-hydroxyanthranilate 3,4-dioxygenase